MAKRKGRANHKDAPGFDKARGEFLAEIRKKAKLTQFEAAAETGVSYDVVAKAEQGRDLMTSSFLALLKRYGHYGDLVKWLAEWEPAARPVAGAGGREAAG